MVEFTEEQLKRLHKSGATLSKARLFYAHPDLKSQWEELEQKSAIEAFQTGIEEADAKDGDATARITHAFSRSQAILVPRSRLEKRLKSDILSYISNGHLHGFGFEPSRRFDSVPVPIPKRAWSGRIDWENNTLTFESIRLVEVRLTTNRIRNEVLERGQVDSAPARTPGRPSIRQAVENAFDALHKAGKIDTGKSMKSHFPAVRHWLNLNRPDLPTPAAKLTDEGIRAHFSPKFKGLKEGNKK